MLEQNSKWPIRFTWTQGLPRVSAGRDMGIKGGAFDTQGAIFGGLQ